jgi:cell division protein FtsL
MGENLMRPIEVRFEKNINNLTLVREADTRRQWDYIAVAMLGALFVVGFLFYGWQHYQYLQYGYKIEDAQKKQERLTEKRDGLRLHREELQSPTRIAGMAKEMGMVPHEPGQLVTVNLESQENSQPQLSAKK